MFDTVLKTVLKNNANFSDCLLRNIMSKQKTVFVTGGTGYIGSHCIVDLLNEGYEVITIDNLTNSRSGALRRVEEITGKKVTFYECDLLDGQTVHKIFAKVQWT